MSIERLLPQTEIRPKSEAAFTILELLVSMIIFTMLMASIIVTLPKTSKEASDQEVRAEANDLARTTLDYLAYDIRMAGAGIPFYQSGFSIGGTGLDIAPLPILLTSNDSNLTLRLNEQGLQTVLTGDFPPSAANLRFTVLSVADLSPNTTIYISDVTVAGTAGLRAVVKSITAGTRQVEINSTYIATPSTTFKAGSTVERVTDVTYTSSDDWSGITRTSGDTTLLVAPRSQFSLTYLDTAGSNITLPLTNAVVKTNLSSIRVSISVRGKRPLSSGEIYTATAVQEVTLRNLVLSR